ncbi:hypothetical protein PHLGIDRAFT_417412 [Phlebiopsis gigantea 11061_1 CR5-6]|uniref:Uncharacterized protein n=1 Tax=Phlebiopsis gigantea (strain 11061_1 CR5-6) TaxID=745531 RepID=A0A0C3PVG1_PHLG1|nr:hypothetical protein PHLGIDRAFT_417412 [Phlebiopsis gigantea 11061_1 CR5-6]
MFCPDMILSTIIIQSERHPLILNLLSILKACPRPLARIRSWATLGRRLGVPEVNCGRYLPWYEVFIHIGKRDRHALDRITNLGRSLSRLERQGVENAGLQRPGQLGLYVQDTICCTIYTRSSRFGSSLGSNPDILGYSSSSRKVIEYGEGRHHPRPCHFH